MADAPPSKPLLFTGAKSLSTRLILSTLTGRPIRIMKIRSTTSSTATGLLPHEISLLRLLDAVTNGSRIEFSMTGTGLSYAPGLIVGSGSTTSTSSSTGNRAGVVRHEVPAECRRGASYFLLPLALLAPFAKTPINVLLTGPGCITSATSHGDVSVDTLRTAILPLFARFGVQNNIELRVLRRSNPGAGGRGGGGEVQLVFGHQVRLPKTLHWMHPGRVKRVRGVAYATGVGGAMNARVIETVRGVLNPLVPDTYIFSDVSSAPFVAAAENSRGGKGVAPQDKKKKTGIGFGISLVAETASGALYSADVASPPAGGVTPEDIGRQAAFQLLETIEQGGCVPKVAAETVLVLMAMGSEDVGRVRLGRDVLGCEEVVGLARDLRAFGGSGWGVRDVDDDGEEDGRGDVVVSVVGRGVGNVGRKIA
ncbi:18S rRNA biogenesis protein [Aulographum hederae CBS 113979]|uniref:18S rRNA biogenesis protein n=1 Tax=Aulographum hederae CBS 113979 TaxID=1176131 RepID=A0A6G1GKE6_9PEZI|nr:18S rRNA biogenesis protein [Aulographum hederae CBS 113979]